MVRSARPEEDAEAVSSRQVWAEREATGEEAEAEEEAEGGGEGDRGRRGRWSASGSKPSNVPPSS
jgi:hypothetical protein